MCYSTRLWKQNVAGPGRECGVSLQLPSFPSGGKTFFQGEGLSCSYALVTTRLSETGGINIYTVGRFDSKPKLTSAKFSRGKLLLRVIAASSNVWILFIPSEISFLEILFLNVATRSCNLECTSILKRSNELIKSMEKNDRKFDESY